MNVSDSDSLSRDNRIKNKKRCSWLLDVLLIFFQKTKPQNPGRRTHFLSVWDSNLHFTGCVFCLFTATFDL